MCIVILIISVLQIHAAAYSNIIPLDMSSTSNLQSFYPLIDDVSALDCIPSAHSQSELLQVAFAFGNYTPRALYVNVKINLTHAEPCSKLFWTWYTGSSCLESSYTECILITDDVTVDSSHHTCRLRCPCVLACDYFYVQSNWVSWVNQDQHYVCAVELDYTLAETDDVIHIL